MKRLKLLFFVMTIACQTRAQKKVAFTIDDVPNSVLYNKEGFKCRLLDKIDSLKLPVAIFINEQRIFSTDSIEVNLNLFNNWIKSKHVTIGNHAYSHAMYSAVGIDSFKVEVLKGEAISKELAAKQGKQENYFRFPYNDLGKDAKQHEEAATFLKTRNYIITPFTIHSEDWMVTELYAYYKNHNKEEDAKRIGKAFIEKTLEYFDYIEKLTSKKAGRDVKQIYLMHDNILNADWLGELINSLKERGYEFITLGEAMSDPVYSQKDYFHEKPGISWAYRWIEDKNKRNEMIKRAPDVSDFEREFERLNKIK